jgi:hypothetical protein
MSDQQHSYPSREPFPSRSRDEHRAQDCGDEEDRHAGPSRRGHHENRRPHQDGSARVEIEETEITVNVNINECGHRGHCNCRPGSGSSDHGGHHLPGTGTGTGCGDPGSSGGRPVYTTGTSDGSIKDGVNTVGTITAIPQRPPTVWPGDRTKLYMPILFIRHSKGDTGARPIQGTFWESPDIIILPGIHPSVAPDKPPEHLGGYAKAGADNTVYAHVWNFGQATCWRTLVEFYWFNPTLGFDSKDANLIGHAHVDLGGRCTREHRKFVKCPVPWKAKYENGGHECVVVRVSHPVKDPLTRPAWDARQNRKVAQRNIHVMTAAEAAAHPTIGVNIGPLFGAPAAINVARADTATMPWLHLVTMSRTNLPGNAAATGAMGITGAIDTGAGLPHLGQVDDPKGAGLIGDSTQVHGDAKQVGFVTKDGNPGNGNAHVYRVSGAQDGQMFGGYTIVILGS